MHLLPIQSRTLDEDAPAVDLDLTPAGLLFLSFTDTDLAVAAEAWKADSHGLPSLRLISLARLKHPYSVDLFVEKLAARARFVVVRLLGGTTYWRYGIDELAAAARRHGFALACLPGDDCDDDRLGAASTLPAESLARLAVYFRAGGVENVGRALRCVVAGTSSPGVPDPTPVPAAGIDPRGCRPGESGGPHALILFYRSAFLAADTAPVGALADALASHGARVTSVFVTSLKDPGSTCVLADWFACNEPDVILNTTAFSARDAQGCVLDRADAPVLQAILSGSGRDTWAESARGLAAADLAMNVVLPEVDGRIDAGVISFKASESPSRDLEFARVVHRPDQAGIGHVVELALGWAALRRTPRAARRIACIVPDYPGKQGRAGYAVGLEVDASLVEIAGLLCDAGFAVEPVPSGSRLMQQLTSGEAQRTLDLDTYRHQFAQMDTDLQARVLAAWGDPAEDPDCTDGWFRLRLLRVGQMVVAVQPDRGTAANRRADYHDAALLPRHAYIAFYLWLRTVECCHALVHLGTHGTLEWLPGKAVALSPACAPLALAGGTPVIYPFIVNNPGEAAQAKRRIGAVTVGHLTPPLIESGLHGETADLEQLFDEYAEALTLDPRRARLIGRAILVQATERGLLPDAARNADPDDALAALDNWLCDLKEARIGDGLHIFGRSVSSTGGSDPALAACGPAEHEGLLRALDGRFVAPGPSGAPTRGRQDVLPTGRNLFTVDPRAVPTRTAAEIGARMAEDLVTRYAQDHGEWPRRVVLDLWGSATMRTGGDDLAQAFALLGVRPRWDHGSARVIGFDILPLAKLGRSRVDVTLRISGLFRDAFPDQIALYASAVRTIADLDEEDGDNPLAEARRDGRSLLRVFGAAPGAYGIGVADRLNADPAAERTALGRAYLEATSHAFASAGQPTPAAGTFADRVAAADAFSHTVDLPGQDILDSDTLAEHHGGFAAAAALLGGAPAAYHADTGRPEAVRLRSLAEAITVALHARATNPRWIAGQMRHGYRGAIGLAETLDALYAFAAMTDAVPPRHFDLYFDATLGDDSVRAFLERENAAAARGMARKFASAIDQGYWVTRRNSILPILAELGAEPSGTLLATDAGQSRDRLDGAAKLPALAAAS